jgi:hypothetical protein
MKTVIDKVAYEHNGWLYLKVGVELLLLRMGTRFTAVTRYR